MEGPEMNEGALRAACKRHRLYQNPALNDKLYCNFKGFTSIAALEPYTGLQALFLEGNALESTTGIPPLPKLRCLFLQQNVLSDIAPGTLTALPVLHTLNLSSNQLRSLAGLEGCTQLHTLVVTDNLLGPSADALLPLTQGCTALECLDLQNNRLEDGPAVLQACAQLPALKCLYLKGNPLVQSMGSYRKATIAAIPTLTYLDDRPVFEVERLGAEAWARGGLEAEREARAAYRQRELEREKRQVAVLREIREAGWRKQREAMGLHGSGDPYLDDLPEDWEPEEEPEELRAARERLATLTASSQHDEQLPGLVEADMRAVLEERSANQAALHAGITAAAQASCCSAGEDQPASSASATEEGNAENGCPNGAAAAGPAACAAEQPSACAGDLPAPGVPQAKVTVAVSASAAPPAEQQALEPQSKQPEASAEESLGQGCDADGLQAEGRTFADAGADSDSDGSASVSEEEAEDFLLALD